jgi:hypothetical protein
MKLGIFGLVLTAIYVWSIYLFLQDRVDQAWSMPLNEFGDLLAGVFGPIAIFWLVLGFFNKGKSSDTVLKHFDSKRMN